MKKTNDRSLICLVYLHPMFLLSGESTRQRVRQIVGLNENVCIHQDKGETINCTLSGKMRVERNWAVNRERPISIPLWCPDASRLSIYLRPGVRVDRFSPLTGGRSIATVSGEQAKGLNEVTQCFSENMALTIQTVSSEVVCVHFYTHFRSFQIAQFKENALN